jgi:hypothetical protein
LSEKKLIVLEIKHFDILPAVEYVFENGKKRIFWIANDFSFKNTVHSNIITLE